MMSTELTEDHLKILKLIGKEQYTKVDNINVGAGYVPSTRREMIRLIKERNFPDNVALDIVDQIMIIIENLEDRKFIIKIKTTERNSWRLTEKGEKIYVFIQ